MISLERRTCQGETRGKPLPPQRSSYTPELHDQRSSDAWRKPVIPEPGDVIVRRQCPPDGPAYYTLSTGSSPPQVVLREYERAVQTAIGFAQQHRVRAWLADGQAPPMLLDVAAV